MVPLCMFQKCYEKLQKRYGLRDDGKQFAERGKEEGCSRQREEREQ